MKIYILAIASLALFIWLSSLTGKETYDNNYIYGMPERNDAQFYGLYPLDNEL